jgi:hypothetical protein
MQGRCLQLLLKLEFEISHPVIELDEKYFPKYQKEKKKITSTVKKSHATGSS